MTIVPASDPPVGFKQIALVEKVSRAINTDWLTTDLDFQNVPTGQLKAIRLQLIVPTASIVNITTDGTIFDAINNGVAIEGVFSFPLIVSKNTKLNIQHETATQGISAYIGEDQPMSWLHLPDDPHSNDKVDFLWWSLNPSKPHAGTNDIFLLTEDGIIIATEDGIDVVSEESP